MLYLAFLEGHELDAATPGPWSQLRSLRPGLLLIASEASRSAVYHAVKDELPSGWPLLVTRLHEVPKLRGMDAGSLAWARRQDLG